ncbi:MAG TPA: M56 family metallopeptidase, partial [Hyphomonadaceae bacterium]|nr:M56 family metallopeptidase [Hyphomonadaceae bacterium]
MTDAVSVFVLPNLVFTAGILAVLALRKPVRAQFGARMAYALWLLPLLVLAASFLPPRVVEIVQSAPLFDAMPSGPEYVLPAAPREALPAAPVFTAAAKPIFDPLLAALILWITGALAMFAWLGRRQALFMTDVRKGTAGPAVIGVFRPRIITPSDFDMRFDESEKRVILTHETIHLARQDARINALVALIRCICWYNPLVHIGAHCMRIDQELACDAAVVERHPKARRLYADALLKAQLAARPLPLGCYWPAGTEHPLMERIEMLKQSAPGQFRRIAGLALLITLTAGAATAAWAAMPPTTRVVYEDPQQSPTPAAAQKVDYDWSNMVRIEGKVVSVNLDGSPPTVQVQGVQLNSADR